MRKTSNKIDEKTGLELRLTPRGEAFNLAAHGTAAVALSPRNLIQTADSDLRAKERNRLIRAELAKPFSRRSALAEEPILPYAFGSDAVESAADVAALLGLAVARRAMILSLGIEDQDRREAAWRKLPLSTFRVYQDADILAQAAEMAAVSEQVAA